MKFRFEKKKSAVLKNIINLAACGGGQACRQAE